MVLLVAQLKAQDPMSPMDPSEFMNQLAQLQTVAELTEINSMLAQSFHGQRIDSALSLIDRTVRWNDSETGEELSGRVESVSFADGGCHLIVGGREVSLDLVVSVS